MISLPSEDAFCAMVGDLVAVWFFSCIAGAGDTMGASQCGNDRPGFGVHSVSQKLSANNYKRISGF